MRLSLGDKAPDFELCDENKRSISLSDYHGMWVLVFFHDGDAFIADAPERASVNAVLEKLSEKDAIVLCISSHTTAEIKHFKKSAPVSFIALSDEDAEVKDLYGALDERTRVLERNAFLIDTDGVIVKMYKEKNIQPLFEAVLEHLEEFQTL